MHLLDAIMFIIGFGAAIWIFQLINEAEENTPNPQEYFFWKALFQINHYKNRKRKKI